MFRVTEQVGKFIKVKRRPKRDGSVGNVSAWGA